MQQFDFMILIVTVIATMLGSLRLEVEAIYIPTIPRY